MSQSGAVNNEFDAAKIIVETLKELEQPQQQRAMKFASEALGLPIKTSPINQSLAQSETLLNDVATRDALRVTDIRQFTESKSPKSDQQFAAVVAYYYQFEAPPSERQEKINAELLGKAARLTGRRRPSRHALNNAKRSGYLDSAGHGDFHLNTVGENLVAMTLPSSGGERGKGRPVTKKKGTPRRRVPAKKRARKK
jgi:hypothetical protein